MWSGASPGCLPRSWRGAGDAARTSPSCASTTRCADSGTPAATTSSRPHRRARASRSRTRSMSRASTSGSRSSVPRPKRAGAGRSRSATTGSSTTSTRCSSSILRIAPRRSSTRWRAPTGCGRFMARRPTQREARTEASTRSMPSCRRTTGSRCGVSSCATMRACTDSSSRAGPPPTSFRSSHAAST